MRLNKTLGAIAAVALLGSVLAGCASEGTTSSKVVADHTFSATAAGKALDTTDTNHVCASGQFTVISATGQTTDGDKFTLAAQHCRVAGKATNGSATMTMANGDQIRLTYESVWVLDSTGSKVNGTGPFKVVGGTGEFANVVGKLDHTCVTSVSGSQPWPVEFTFKGTLTY
jgi:hypothetical protein